MSVAERQPSPGRDERFSIVKTPDFATRLRCLVRRSSTMSVHDPKPCPDSIGCGCGRQQISPCVQGGGRPRGSPREAFARTRTQPRKTQEFTKSARSNLCGTLCFFLAVHCDSKRQPKSHKMMAKRRSLQSKRPIHAGQHRAQQTELEASPLAPAQTPVKKAIDTLSRRTSCNL